MTDRHGPNTARAPKRRRGHRKLGTRRCSLAIETDDALVMSGQPDL